MEKRIAHLIRQGEGSTLDFKQVIAHPGKIARTLSAFANSDGGRILVGVTDAGRVVGVHAEEEKFMLQQAARCCDPPVSVSFEELTPSPTAPRPVLLASVSRSDLAPHRCPDRHGRWQIYLRRADQTLKATPDQIEDLRRRAAPPPTYTNNQRAAFEYLSYKNKLTLKDYAKLVNVSKRRAEHILKALVLDGDLCLAVGDKQAYTLAG